MTPDQLNGFTQMMASMPADQMERMMQQMGGMGKTYALTLHPLALHPLILHPLALHPLALPWDD